MSTPSFADRWQQFLKRLWDLSGGFMNQSVPTGEVTATLNFDAAMTRRVTEYLFAKHFIKNGRDDMVSLTSDGIDELQRLGLI